MTERITVPAAATLLLPLLAAAALAPAGLDQALDPLLAGGLPLAWAVLWTILFKAGHRGMGAAFIAALPFTVLSLASFASRPFAAQFLVLATCSVTVTAVHALPRRERVEPIHALASAAAGLPGLFLAAFAGPWQGVAVSMFLTVSALYLRQRRLR